MKKYDLTRESILTEAHDRCMAELYEKAQPSADINEYIKKIKSGEITKEDQHKEPIYDRHYLSRDEMKYIVDKYHKAYRMDNEFKDACDLLLSDMKKSVPVDKYIEAHDDEHGHHPGYRGYEDRPPMKERILATLRKRWPKEQLDEVTKALTKLFEDFIIERRDFYAFDRDAQKFDNSVYLGASPTSSKKTVIDYWKSQGVDIDIVDRDPEKLWYYDQGWTEEEIEEEFNPRPIYDEDEEGDSE